MPDAIVVDVMLGLESGWELIRALQADPRCRALLIVVLSGRAPLEPPPSVHPCAAYLRKPCRMADLRALLAQLLVAPPPNAALDGAATERDVNRSSSSDA